MFAKVLQGQTELISRLQKFCKGKPHPFHVCKSFARANRTHFTFAKVLQGQTALISCLQKFCKGKPHSFHVCKSVAAIKKYIACKSVATIPFPVSGLLPNMTKITANCVF